MNKKKTAYTIFIGDFITNIDKIKKNNKGSSVREFGQRNEKGEMLLNLREKYKIYVRNTIIQKNNIYIYIYIYTIPKAFITY